MKKVALHNLGCKVNAYEMEAMQQILVENGYVIVPFSEKADIYIEYLLSNQYGGPEIKADAPSGEA